MSRNAFAAAAVGADGVGLRAQETVPRTLKAAAAARTASDETDQPRVVISTYLTTFTSPPSLDPRYRRYRRHRTDAGGWLWSTQTKDGIKQLQEGDLAEFCSKRATGVRHRTRGVKESSTAQVAEPVTSRERGPDV